MNAPAYPLTVAPLWDHEMLRSGHFGGAGAAIGEWPSFDCHLRVIVGCPHTMRARIACDGVAVTVCVCGTVPIWEKRR